MDFFPIETMKVARIQMEPHAIIKTLRCILFSRKPPSVKMSPAEERLSSMQGSTKRRASARKRRLSEKLSDQMDHDTSECIYPAAAEHQESLVEDRLTRDEAGGASSSQHQASVRAVFKHSRRSSRRRRLAKIALMVSLLQSTCFVAGKAFPSLFLVKV